MCSAPESLEITPGQEMSVEVDLLAAPLATSSLCPGNGGPERVYRFSLSEESYVHAVSERPSPVSIMIAADCERGLCTSTSGKRLNAGEHYLIVRGPGRTDFSQQSITLQSTPLAPVCESAILLRAGVTGGTLGESDEPALFGAECSADLGFREAIYRVRALHPMHIRVLSEGVGLSIHEGCGGRSLTCAPPTVGAVEARLEPGDYTLLVRGRAGRPFQLQTGIERL